MIILNFLFHLEFQKKSKSKTPKPSSSKNSTIYETVQEWVRENNFCTLRLLLCYNSYVNCYISVYTIYRFKRNDVKKIILNFLPHV